MTRACNVIIRWEALDWDRAFLHKKSPARGLKRRYDTPAASCFAALPTKRNKSFSPATLTWGQVNESTK